MNMHLRVMQQREHPRVDRRGIGLTPSPSPLRWRGGWGVRGIAKSELRDASRQGMNPLARKRKPLSGLGRDDVRRDATLILPAISPQTVLCPSESFVPAPIGAFCSEPGNSFPGALAHDDSDFAIPLGIGVRPILVRQLPFAFG